MRGNKQSHDCNATLAFTPTTDLPGLGTVTVAVSSVAPGPFVEVFAAATVANTNVTVVVGLWMCDSSWPYACRIMPLSGCEGAVAMVSGTSRRSVTVTLPVNCVLVATSRVAILSRDLVQRPLHRPTAPIFHDGRDYDVFALIGLCFRPNPQF